MIDSILDGKYRILRRLGEGGMGTVFEALHLGTGRHVAVKVITSGRGDDEAAVTRFQREARAAGAIDSEHIAQVLDSGRDPATGHPFLVMELLLGEDLDQLLARVGPLPPDLAVRIAAQACLGLQKAHAAGVVHRDIKPANLFLARRDEGRIAVKVLDFGIAKIKLGEAELAATALTGVNSLLGSPLYMSPEQTRGSRTIDHLTDVWSLGVVLYKMLTLEAPHQNVEALGELIVTLCSTPAPPVHDLAPWVAPELGRLVRTALALHPSERFPSAAAMLDALKELVPGGLGIDAGMLVALTAEERGVVAPLSRVGQASPGVATSATLAYAGPSSGAGAQPSDPWVPLSAPAERPAATTTARSGAVPAPVPGGAVATTTGASVASPPSAPGASSPSPVRRFVWVGAALALVIGSVGASELVRRVGAAPAAPVVVASLPAPSSSTASASVSSAIDPGRLASFAALPTVVNTPGNPLTDEKIKLGRMLFYDARLSKNQDVACNTCHALDAYAIDGKSVAVGHAQQAGKRNAPSVYNTAGYFALLWDGQAANLEDQAKLPFLRPNEMAMTDKRIEATLRSMPEYVAAFAKAFPTDGAASLSFGNAARAIAAFERKLFTPGRWDRFLAGESGALTGPEKAGFNTFVETGCVTCHFGPYIGASMFQKLGLVKAWPDTRDRGRFEATQQDIDYMIFRVPSLRNVAVTPPYFHDGSISSLDEAVKLMARHQLGTELGEERTRSIVTWLKALTGEIPAEYVAKPALPPSGPTTPKAEPE